MFNAVNLHNSKLSMGQPPRSGKRAGPAPQTIPCLPQSLFPTFPEMDPCAGFCHHSDSVNLWRLPKWNCTLYVLVFVFFLLTFVFVPFTPLVFVAEFCWFPLPILYHCINMSWFIYWFHLHYFLVWDFINSDFKNIHISVFCVCTSVGSIPTGGIVGP